MRLIISVVISLISVTAMGQLIEVPVARVTRPSILWDTLVYRDVLNHGWFQPMPNPDDKVNMVHESTHDLNAELSIKIGNPKVYIYYCLNGKAYKVKRPNVSLLDIMKELPYVGNASFYLVQRPYDAYYMGDELSAYINGCQCGLEIGAIVRTEFSFQHACQLCQYCILINKHAKQTDLKEYIDHQIAVLKVIRTKLPLKTGTRDYDTMINMQEHFDDTHTTGSIVQEVK